MPRQRRNTAPVDPDQLGLNLRGEGFEGPLEARGVFSTAYLARHLRNAPDFASENDVTTAFREIAEIWRLRLTALGRQNEAFNCSSFLEPILDRLGWLRIPQQSMPNDFATRKRPDYCLFTSESDFTAASEADANTLFRLGATVVEAKKYGHPLDQLSNNETPGWFPSQQIQDYLNHAKDANGRRFFNWAILTNGSEWRIYTDRSTVGGTKTAPEKKLPLLPAASGIVWNEPPTGCVRHATVEELRVHSVPRALYADAHKRAFFEPRPGTLALFDRFNAPVKQLVSEWWTRIEDSRAFAGNLGEIRSYHRTLRPGGVTLVGLIAEGGQGMRTANNARFLAYLEGTPQAGELDKKAAEWSAAWLGKPSIAPAFRQFLTEAGGNPGSPVRNRAARKPARVGHFRKRTRSAFERGLH